MFTGLIEEVGFLRDVAPGKASIRLKIEAKKVTSDMKIGDSLAVNGCCLTVVQIRKSKSRSELEFDLLEETWSRTSFKQLKPGNVVNLERSLTPSSRLGGHFVTGHIDGVGTIKTWRPEGKDHFLEISAPKQMVKYLLPKGSIAVNGISLTVGQVNDRRATFNVWIIPHTFNATDLRERKTGDLVNLEFDLLGKYVERFIARN